MSARRRVDDVVRRGLDAGLGLTLLLVLSPLIALLAVLVKATSSGPAFFVQQRVGRYGRPFSLLKFRTMVVDAPEKGRAITVSDDPRITRVGRVLRQYKLDELPQLLNVVTGDMSLVGPRPEVPTYVADYTPEQRRILAVRPGLTDPASLVFKDESKVLAAFADPERAYRQQILPQKLAISLDYLSRRSVLSDLGIILRTALYVLIPGLSPRGAHEQEPDAQHGKL